MINLALLPSIWEWLNQKPKLYNTFDPSHSRYKPQAKPQTEQNDQVQQWVMNVRNLKRETANAVTLQLERADGQRMLYEAGQFLTLLVNIDGKVHRRSYSFSSQPDSSSRCDLTCKRVPDGLVSNYLNTQLKVGQQLLVEGPNGFFTAPVQPLAARQFVFIAGGSGITPIMSLCETLLAREPQSTIQLLYGNRAWDEVIFRDRLQALAQKHPNLLVHHVLEEADQGFEGAVGRLDKSMIKNHCVGKEQSLFYVCGPGPMLEGALEALQELGVPESRVKVEHFVSRHKPSADLPQSSFQISYARSGRQIKPDQVTSILQAGLDQGMPLQHSCTMGGCAACKCKLLKGEVVMEEPNTLSAQEREAGYILSCVAYPTTDVEVDC